MPTPEQPQQFNRDTPTGTDPDAKYEGPGFEDKSFGQAVKQDQELVDQLMDETEGDEAEAERRFATSATGAPAIDRQRREQRAGEIDGDEEPDDSKMYTGEPVETERGTRRPQQMNVGRDNMEGGGEWPDPKTAPAR
jgi:hypothetical protein